MLFWAEGSKNKNQVAFTNSDVEMMQLFRHFLAACYSVPDDRMVLSCSCFLNNGLTLEEIEAYWLRSLALPQTCLRKAVINQASRASGRGKRTLPYGTARIVVNSTEIVQSIYGAIQEYAGIERPAWLDCR